MRASAENGPPNPPHVMSSITGRPKKGPAKARASFVSATHPRLGSTYPGTRRGSAQRRVRCHLHGRWIKGQQVIAAWIILIALLLIAIPAAAQKSPPPTTSFSAMVEGAPALPAGALQAGDKIPVVRDGRTYGGASSQFSTGLDATGSYYGFGNALFPIYAVPASTTATTTNGSPTIIVTSATGISQFNLITAAFVPFGTYVVSVVGTTITMSANATATNASPVPAIFGMQRMQYRNSVMTNTLAAQNGLFGTAARGTDTWVSQFFPALELNWASIFSISPIGQAAVATAVRSSDNTVPGSNSIANICLVSADNTTIPILSWCSYMQSHLPATASQTNHIQLESSLENYWTLSGDEDPYNVNPAVSVRNVRLDNGIALATPSAPASAAMDIVDNGGKYRSGIIFDANAFDYSDARAYAPAIAMAGKQASCWYVQAGGRPAWCLWADVATPKRFHMTDVASGIDFLSVDQATGALTLGETARTTTVNGTLIAVPPTSCAGLPTGALWNNSGLPAICP
jgi:hypothetical protein